MATHKLYDILGVESGASTDEIKRAYRNLALRLHPDKNPSDETAHRSFQEINQAYSTLVDGDKRMMYDMTGDEDELSSMMHASTSYRDDESDFMNLDAIFRNFAAAASCFPTAGQRRQQQRPVRRSDCKDTIAEIYVTPRELKNGTTKTLKVVMNEGCKLCEQSGIGNPEARYQTCGSCAGRGTSMRRLSAFVAVQTVCAMCGGEGGRACPVTPSNACTSCGGSGCIDVKRTVKVSTPPGVANGHVFRWKTNDSGSLIVNVFHDETCKRYFIDPRNGNVYTTLGLTLREVLTGYEKTVDIMGEPKVIQSGEGGSSNRRYTDPSKHLVIRGGGIRNGDFIIKFAVQWPSEEPRRGQTDLDTKRNDETAKRLRKYADVIEKILHVEE